MNNHQLKKNQKILLVIAVGLLFHLPALAQSSSVVSKLNDTAANIKPILDVIVGILAMVGGVGIFFEYKSGNEKAKTHLIQLMMGLTLWLVLPFIVKVFVPAFVW